MGYFDLAEFSYLEGIRAYWFTRLPQTVNLVSSSGDSLEKILKEATGDKIDQEVLVGKIGHRCRLVAVRADLQTTEKRRRERHQRARQTGKNASQKALIRDGWHLMLTNLAWKQSTHLTSALNRKSNKWHLEALVLSAMIVALMGLKQMEIYARKVSLSQISPEKLMDWISEDILKGGSVEKLATTPPELRHIKRDSSKGKSPVVQGLIALS